MTSSWDVLTPEQQETVDHYKAYNVPAQWFVGDNAADGTVEVLALGDDFVWSLRIAPNGRADTSEAKVGPFETGIEL